MGRQRFRGGLERRCGRWAPFPSHAAAPGHRLGEIVCGRRSGVAHSAHQLMDCSLEASTSRRRPRAARACPRQPTSMCQRVGPWQPACRPEGYGRPASQPPWPLLAWPRRALPAHTRKTADRVRWRCPRYQAGRQGPSARSTAEGRSLLGCPESLGVPAKLSDLPRGAEATCYSVLPSPELSGKAVSRPSCTACVPLALCAGIP